MQHNSNTVDVPDILEVLKCGLFLSHPSVWPIVVWLENGQAADGDAAVDSPQITL